MHMVQEVYEQTARLVPADRPIRLLDLGCCTGLEYGAFTQVNKEIEVTGIQEEEKLADMLKVKSGKRIERLRLIYGNYFNIDLGRHNYNVAISVMEISKYSRKSRLTLYKKVFDALNNDGMYIERDYISGGEFAVPNMSNVFSNQISLLLEAGFQRVEKAWSNYDTIILKAMK